MIARLWTAKSRSTETNRYLSHLTEIIVPKLTAIEGFLGIDVLRRHRAGVDELVVITLWETMEAIRGFAGADEELAVVSPEAQALLQSYDTRATHYEVVHARKPNP